MKKLLIFIISFSYHILIAEPVWQWVNPYPTAEYLSSAQFFNENTGYVTGERGVFLKTTNGGITWILSRVDSIYIDYTKLFFIDQNIGFVFSGSVYRTSNAGLNWTRTFFPGNAFINSLNFINSSTGLAISNDTSIVFRTVNGGLIWNTINIPGGYFFTDLNFDMTGKAFLAGVSDALPVLLSSTNSGLNWSNLNLNFTDTLYPLKIKFAGRNTIFVLGTEYYENPAILIRSTNGGISWNNYQVNNTHYGLTDIEFDDELHGAATGYGGYKYYTSNGGTNWISQRLSDTNKIIFGLCKAGKDLVSTGTVGLIERSTDKGLNWEKVNRSFTEDHLNSVSFANKYTGLVCGYNSVLLRTSNGGINWQSINLQTPEHLSNVKMASEKIAFLTSTNKVLKTTNGGFNWFVLLDSLNGEFSTIALYDSLNILVNKTNSVYRSSDGGISWDRIWNCESRPPFPSDCFYCGSISYPDADLIVMGGAISHHHSESSAAMMRSTDGGSTFNIIFDRNSGGFGMGSVFMVNGSLGFASGGYGWRLRTDDGFNSFIDYGNNTPGFGSFSRLSFYDTLNGVALCGYIYKTTNSGINWNISSNLFPYLRDIEYKGIVNGCAVGFNGSIVILNETINPIGNPPQIPYRFFLFQNYPNPFNPETSFKYELPQTGYTTLKLYDLLGREVKRLVDGINTAGIHVIDDTFNNLASGIYFIQLRQGSYVMSRKIAFVK